MGRMAWGATTPRVCLGSVAIGKRLWRSRAVKKAQSRLSHRAWKSRPKRGIPTSPQPRRRRVINRQPDNSLATKTGPFNLLRTRGRRGKATASRFNTENIAENLSTQRKINTTAENAEVRAQSSPGLRGGLDELMSEHRHAD